MSARGARSRKVQQKDIEKKEKKVAVKGKAAEDSVPYDKLTKLRLTQVSNDAGNAPISRTHTVSSHTTSRSSSTSNSHGARQLNTVRSSGPTENRALRAPYFPTRDSGSISTSSDGGRSKPGYETFAPVAERRNGGRETPASNRVAASHVPSQPKFDSVGSHHLPPNQKSWKGFKVWEGAQKDMRPYGGFEVDQDMQHGSVYIYFKEEQADEDRPLPSLRADLKILENAGSTWISNALMYGRIDNDDDDWMLPSSPESMFPPRPIFQESSYNGQRHMLHPVSPGGQSPPPLDIDQLYGTISSGSTFSVPPYSDYGRSERSNSPRQFQQRKTSNPTHEIWFAAPDSTKSPQEQRLHHVAVRNYLAMLHGKPIVGADLFDMLSTLQPEIEIMCDLDALGQSNITPRERSIRMLTNYLGQYGIDDIRNNPRDAIGLLAWSEQDNIKWRQGYLESFVHLAGLMNPHVEGLSDYKRLSVVTRRNLGIAGKMLQLRVMEAEDKLSTFDFPDLWGDTSKLVNSPVYQSYQSFRQFLTNHYAQKYGKWPPATTSIWLDRKITAELQDDLGLLYDYLVDRDVIWSPCEERASRKWEMANRRLDDFKADLPELGVTDMLISFDGKHEFAHIPHPYPLLPKDVSKGAKESKKGLFASLRRDKNKVKDSMKDAKAHLQLSIVFGDATNAEKLGANYTGSALIEEFEKFELSTDSKHTTPREARLGHWVLLYGILQVLSTLSVDTQGLKHTDDVDYFLCVDVNRCPGWVTSGQVEFLQASQQRSWCWQRAWDPSPMQTAPVELDASVSSTTGQEDEDVGDSVNRHRNTTSSLSSAPPTPSLDSIAPIQRHDRHTAEHGEMNPLAHSPHSPTAGHHAYPESPDGSIHPAFRRTEEEYGKHEYRHETVLSSRNLPKRPVVNVSEYGLGAEELGWPVPPGYEAGGRREGRRDGPWM